MFLRRSERHDVKLAGCELMRTLSGPMEDRRLAVYCKFRKFYQAPSGYALSQQGMALAGMFFVSVSPSAQERRSLLFELEDSFVRAKAGEIQRHHGLGMMVPPTGDDGTALMWVVLTKGVEMDGYENVSVAMDLTVSIMHGDADGCLRKWEEHSEWARLTLFFGESPERVVIREANEVRFDVAMDEEGVRVGALLYYEVGGLSIEERRLRRAFLIYCVYGFESRYWE